MGKDCFCATPPEGDNAQLVSSAARPHSEKQCPGSSAEESFASAPPEDVNSGWTVGKRNNSAGKDASQETVTSEEPQREDAGAHFLVATSSKTYTVPIFQPELTDTLRPNNPTIRASQQQEKQRSVLQLAPMALRFPSYREHLRYELSKFKTFWSCDLHHRDWRQVFATSPFSNAVPPNRLLVVRIFICLLILVTEVGASMHSHQNLGWSALLYFTNIYCILVSVFWILITAVSFRTLMSWEEPLCGKPTSRTDPLRGSEGNPTTASRTQHGTSASTTGQPSDTFCCETLSTNENGMSSPCFRDTHLVWRTTVQGENRAKDERRKQPLLRFLRVRMKELLASAKKFWRMQGYKDLLADRRFCVKGIIFAPNPTCCPPARKNMAAGSSYDPSSTLQEDCAPVDVCEAQRALVYFLWILHSVQLICSTTVFVGFFASMRANGTSFTEAWYTVWRHLVLILINIFHSAFLIRAPLPICHVVFVYIIWVLYIIVQVFVFAFHVPNGEGDRGCVYRVFTLSKPIQFTGLGFMSLLIIAVVTVSWWSLLRQRSVDVDPPPSVSVPAAQVLEKEESADAGDAEHKREGKEQRCFNAQVLSCWGKKQSA